MSLSVCWPQKTQTSQGCWQWWLLLVSFTFNESYRMKTKKTAPTCRANKVLFWLESKMHDHELWSMVIWDQNSRNRFSSGFVEHVGFWGSAVTVSVLSSTSQNVLYSYLLATRVTTVDFSAMHAFARISGWWLRRPLRKNMSSSIGMMTFPTEWENKTCSSHHQPDMHSEWIEHVTKILSTSSDLHQETLRFTADSMKSDKE